MRYPCGFLMHSSTQRPQLNISHSTHATTPIESVLSRSSDDVRFLGKDAVHAVGRRNTVKIRASSKSYHKFSS